MWGRLLAVASVCMLYSYGVLGVRIQTPVGTTPHAPTSPFDALRTQDEQVWRSVRDESLRQKRTLNLIASENYASSAVLQVRAPSEVSPWCGKMTLWRYCVVGAGFNIDKQVL